MTESGQLQPEETLDDRGVDDILDEGISPPERPVGVNAVGVTQLEQEEGETLDERLAHEEPDVTAENDDLDSEEDRDPAESYAGDERAGRLVAPAEEIGGDGIYEDVEPDLVGEDVGIDGGAASAEEAAMHVIDEDELDDDELG